MTRLVIKLSIRAPPSDWLTRLVGGSDWLERLDGWFGAWVVGIKEATAPGLHQTDFLLPSDRCGTHCSPKPSQLVARTVSMIFSLRGSLLEMRGPMKQVRLVVLGAGGVGKSSLVSQFMRGVFNTFYEPTVEDCYRHFLHLPDGNMHSIEILDTGGTHQFPAMQELNIKTAHGFIIVYSIDDAESFKEAHKLRKLVVNVKGTENIPLVMVGNKSDLAVDREVQKDEAVTAAREEWRCPFLETSAKYNRNVYDISSPS
ncbi:hypothetical protein Bbelb_228980 [Branchiostoma belcheri]|nr:hypothetical protein Bbelb_228980 [Branchiostoma belcheri]